MAQFKINYVSQAVKDKLNMYITVPQVANDERLPIIILLHNDGSSPYELINKTSVARYVEDRGCVLIAPEGHHSFFADYTVRDRCSNVSNTGNAEIESGFTELCYEKAVFEALDIVRAMFPATSADKVAIGGIGSGGEGAVRIAMKYPDLFNIVFSIDGFLDMKWLTENCPERAEQFEAVFGGKQTEGENDLLSAACSVDENVQPELMQYWDETDYSGEMNELFSKGIEGKYQHYYKENASGDAGWDHIDRSLKDIITRIN